MQKQTTIEKGTTEDGRAVKLVKRGSKFDVVKVNSSALAWVYVAKQVSEAAARSEFFLQTVKL